MSVVLRFSSRSLVTVLTRPEGYWLTLAKIADANNVAQQISYQAINDVVRETHEGAAFSGSRHVGVLYKERLRTLKAWCQQRNQGDAA